MSLGLKATSTLFFGLFNCLKRINVLYSVNIVVCAVVVVSLFLEPRLLNICFVIVPK